MTTGDQRRRASALLAIVAAAGYAALATAQGEPRFTVASVRPSSDNEPGMVAQSLPGGRYSARKVPLMALLTSAFQLSPDRVIGAPAWPDRFDIEARYEAADPAAPAPPVNQLLQSLLRDRFSLVARLEPRDVPVYLLRQARQDGRLGPAMQSSAIRCEDEASAASARRDKVVAANGAPACGAIERPDAFIASGLSMGVVASALRIPSGRPVIDDTGLSGRWDVALRFTPLNQPPDDLPSVFTAVREQLGLTLEPATRPMDVLIVEDVRKPTPN